MPFCQEFFKSKWRAKTEHETHFEKLSRVNEIEKKAPALRKGRSSGLLRIGYTSQGIVSFSIPPGRETKTDSTEDDSPTEVWDRKKKNAAKAKAEYAEIKSIDNYIPKGMGNQTIWLDLDRAEAEPCPSGNLRCEKILPCFFSSPRALLTQANYLARAETIEFAEGSFTAEDRESEATFPSTLPLVQSFHCENLSSESLSLPADSTRAIKATDSRTAETGLIPIPGPGESFQPASFNICGAKPV
ncbi:hypothetical protein Nepgr_004118 [Nepenthes gracilis]|uniref:Uncharacterized protein n=1 Tax=Nepenthes gracilis TaxID=150966 RepID=A0AAD3XEM9_NEPGR|nr:hypothetical protein Nepgr_004118 [Nepenthes gracilis]